MAPSTEPSYSSLPPSVRRPVKMLSRLSFDGLSAAESVTRQLAFPAGANYAAPSPAASSSAAAPGSRRHMQQQQQQPAEVDLSLEGDDDEDDDAPPVGAVLGSPSSSDWLEAPCRPRRLNFASRPSSAAPLNPLGSKNNVPTAEALCGRRSANMAVASSSSSSYSYASLGGGGSGFGGSGGGGSSSSSLAPCSSPRNSASAVKMAAERDLMDMPPLGGGGFMPLSAPSPVARLIASQRPGSAALGSRFNQQLSR